MKVLYIYIGGSKTGSSVQHKIACQLKAMTAAGLDATGVMFTRDERVQDQEEFAPGFRFIRLKSYAKTHRFFHNYFENQDTYRQIAQWLDTEITGYDLVFLRHMPTGPSYIRLLRRFRKKIVLYIPSNTLAENYLERKYAPRTTMVNAAIRWAEHIFTFYIWEKYTYTFMTRRMKAVVAFTPEFCNMIRRRSLFGGVRTVYNRDGADCSGVRLRNPKHLPDGKLRLLFMKGSSMLQPWSGLERLVKSIAARPDIPTILYVTGSGEHGFDTSSYPFIELTGRVSREQLDELSDMADLGVSNLANYMIGFHETTNLKSREYYACGLPFIQANTMPDITGTAGEAWFLNLPNDDSLIDMDRVHEFAMAMRKDARHAADMRGYAEQHLDWNITGRELAGSLTQILES